MYISYAVRPADRSLGSLHDGEVNDDLDALPAPPHPPTTATAASAPSGDNPSQPSGLDGQDQDNEDEDVKLSWWEVAGRAIDTVSFCFYPVET